MADPELLRLLLLEIEHRLASLAPDREEHEQRRALHALKGSAGLAGERALADALARLERRASAGDTTVAAEAKKLLEDTLRALAAGERVPLAAWPLPPHDLAARPLEPSLYGRYVAETQDRLERLDRALSDERDEARAAAAAYREVHAMKGAALAVDDEVTAWFCHGLEERLRIGADPPAHVAKRAVDEVARWRSVLGEMVLAPDQALETLRGRPSTTLPPAPVAPTTRRPPRESEVEGRPVLGEEVTLRVATATLDRLLERVRSVARAHGPVNDGATANHGAAARARELRGRLAEALRLIGPPRPWGAPAAALDRIEHSARSLSALADELDAISGRLAESAERIRTETATAQRDLAAVRTTQVRALFERVAAALTAQARREDRPLTLVIEGGETPVDRRVADALFDPLLQLARNAVAHGIEPVAERLARDKPPHGTVRLSAETRSATLRVRVEDDGSGVDLVQLRRRAVQAGTVSAETAEAADEETLLGLLFVPGFTTRAGADLLAGRGVGLDLALEAVRRLGGSIRLTSRAGEGLTATVDVPIEHGPLRVLWVRAGNATFALPASHARRVLLARDAAEPPVPLSACLEEGEEAGAATPLAIELDARDEGLEGTAALVGVSQVGRLEEVAVRHVSPLVRLAGPFAGAVLRGDELCLCLDGYALAERLMELRHRSAPPSGPASRR